jgi:peptide/nickel transport system substrate-binding protein
MNTAKKIITVMFLLALAFDLPTLWAEEKEPVPIPELNLLSLTASYSPTRFEMSRRLEEIWTKELGLKIKRTMMEYNALIDRAMGPKHDFGMLIMHFSAKPIRLDPDVFTYQFHHSSMDRAFAYNSYGYHDPEFDKLAEEQRRYYDLQKRREVVWKCQEKIYQDQPQTPFIFDQVLFVYNRERWEDPNNYHMDIGGGVVGFWFQWGAVPKTKEGILRAAYNRDFKKLNPLVLADATDYMLSCQIYDSLTRIGPDGKPRMWAAADISGIDDTTLEILLRNDLKFHDGKPCTAEDVKFTFDYLKKWQGVRYVESLKIVDHVEIVGDQKLRLYLAKPFAPIHYTVFAQMPILPKHIWEEIEKKVKDPKTWPNDHPIGSGPYKFVHWKRGSELMLKRFEDHFQPAKPGGLLYLVYGSTDAMAGALETREADVTLQYLQPFQFHRLKKLSHIAGDPLTNHGFFNLWYNCRRKPFSDKNFRNAIARTIPANQFVKDIFEGYAAHESAVIGSANEFWHNPNLPPIEFSIAKAKRILKDAGYMWNKEGRLCYPPEK